MSDRDPRIDPQAGDQLTRSGWYRIVNFVWRGRVSYATRCGHQWLDNVMHVSVEEWRSWAKAAEVQK